MCMLAYGKLDNY